MGIIDNYIDKSLIYNEQLSSTLIYLAKDKIKERVSEFIFNKDEEITIYYPFNK